MTSAENSLFVSPRERAYLPNPYTFGSRFRIAAFEIVLQSVGVFQREEHREEDEDGRLIRAHWKDDPPSFNKN